MTSKINPLRKMFDVLCEDDKDTKAVAWKYYENIRKVVPGQGTDSLPDGVGRICAYLASEHSSTCTVSPTKALEHLNLNKEDRTFWKRVSAVEDLLEKAACDASISPRFHYSRMVTFDNPCDWCSQNGVPCYRVQPVSKKRTSKKCISCFTSGRAGCPPNKEVESDFESDWSPTRRPLPLDRRIDKIQNRDMKKLQKQKASAKPRTNSLILAPFDRNPALTTLKQVQQPLSPRNSDQTPQRIAVTKVVKRERASPASTSLSAPVPLSQESSSTAGPSQPANRSESQASSLVGVQRTGDERPRDPRKRCVSTNTANNASPATPAQRSQQPTPKPSPKHIGVKQERSSSGNNFPGARPSSSATTTSSTPPPIMTSTVKQERSVGTSDSVGQSVSMASVPTPQRKRFATPQINFEGSEQGYLGLPAHLEPVVVPELPPVAQRSPNGALRSPHVQSPAPRLRGENMSVKRPFEGSNEDDRKRRKLGVVSRPPNLKMAECTPRRSAGPGAGSLQTSRVPPTVQFTPPQSRKASPALSTQTGNPQPPPSTAPASAASLIQPFREGEESRIAGIPATPPRLPTPFSPPQQDTSLPDFMEADLRMHRASSAQSDLGSRESTLQPSSSSSPAPSKVLFDRPLTYSPAATPPPPALQKQVQVCPQSADFPRTQVVDQMDHGTRQNKRLASSTPISPSCISRRHLPNYALFVDLVYEKAKEIVEYHTENDAAHLQLKFAVRDMDARLGKIDKLKATAQGADASSEKSLRALKKMLLGAGRKVVLQMEEAQRAGQMDDIALETMIEELAERLEEMEKPNLG